MTSRRTMRWLAPALASVAIVLAVFGGRGVVHELTAESAPSQHHSVLGIAAAHPASAIAERLPEPIGPTSFAYVTAGALVVAGLLLVGATSRVTDRRALAAVNSLQCRRRGPPLQFTV